MMMANNSNSHKRGSVQKYFIFLICVILIFTLSNCGGVTEVLDATKDKIDENRNPEALNENIQAELTAESYFISQTTIDNLKKEGVPARVTNALLPIMNQTFTSASKIEAAFTPLLSPEDLFTYKFSILRYSANGG